MTVEEMIEYLKLFPGRYELRFLCPDGYEDEITKSCEIDSENQVITFLPYTKRENHVKTIS